MSEISFYEGIIDWHFDECCSPEEPCAVVERVLEITGGRAKRAAVSRTAGDDEVRDNRPAAGSVARNQFGTFTVHEATEGQMRFIKRLLNEREVPTTRLGAMEQRIKTYHAGTINKKAASSLIEWLLGLPETQATAVSNRASEKQVAFLSSLVESRNLNNIADPEGLKQDLAAGTISKRDASTMIEFLKGQPRVQVAEVELEAGMYYREDTNEILKVYRAVHGSGKMVAKVLVLEEGPGAESNSGRFEYKGLASRFVKPEHRMTLEQAKAFGAIYGVCCQCGRTLTDEGSIEAGIGPVCARKFG